MSRAWRMPRMKTMGFFGDEVREQGQDEEAMTTSPHHVTP